jgi:hypothetical protein
LDKALKAATTRSTSFTDFPFSDFLDMRLPPHKIYLDIYIVIKEYTIFELSVNLLFSIILQIESFLLHKPASTMKMLDFKPEAIMILLLG